jgi:asparaginyl-tRNA synthetase
MYCFDYGYESLVVLDDINPGLIERLKTFICDEPVVMTYTEAVDKVQKSGEFEGVEWGIDLGSEHETWLCEVMGNKLLILTDYPADIKAFYMYQNPDSEDGRRTVACMDVLIPGIGEIIGGSQRESRLEILEPKMEKLGLGGPEYDFYRDLRKFGYAGSSGFGLGVERMIRFVTGIKQIRDVIPFPVSYGKIST